MHKKEVNYSIVILIVMVCIGIIFFSFLQGEITGNAVFQLGDEETLLQKVVELANRLPLVAAAGPGAEACILIDVGNDEVYSFQVFNNKGKIEVNPSLTRYCSNDGNNTGSEDFIIKYVDYDSFIDHYNNPTCEKFIRNSAGEDFYYLPSEFIRVGGTPVCNDLFRDRYCQAVAQCISKRQMHLNGLDCCIEKKGIYALPFIFWDTKILVAIVGVLLILIVLTAGLILHKHTQLKHLEKKRKEILSKGQKQLEKYVKDTKDMGFKREVVETHLKHIGWKKDHIDKAFEKHMVHHNPTNKRHKDL